MGRAQSKVSAAGASLRRATASISCKRVSELSAREYAQCLRLTLGDDGEMRGCLQDARRYERLAGGVGAFAPAQVLLAQAQNGRLLAWCLFGGQLRAAAQIFVHPRARCQGLGTALMHRLLAAHPHATVSVWDESGYTFFACVSRELGVKFAVNEQGYSPSSDEDE